MDENGNRYATPRRYRLHGEYAKAPEGIEYVSEKTDEVTNVIDGYVFHRHEDVVYDPEVHGPRQPRRQDLYGGRWRWMHKDHELVRSGTLAQRVAVRRALNKLTPRLDLVWATLRYIQWARRYRSVAYSEELPSSLQRKVDQWVVGCRSAFEPT